MSVAQKVKELVREIDPQAELHLFGSRARGDATSQSDWDFLILTSSQATLSLKRSIWKALYAVELECGEVIHSVISAKSTWVNSRHWPIHQEIEKEGILI